MKKKLSLTTRLSLVFSLVMLSVWWLSSFLLITALNSYFDHQDKAFLKGKLQLTAELLKTEVIGSHLNTDLLYGKINDAMVGHAGLFISIKTAENQKIVDVYSKNALIPNNLLNNVGSVLNAMVESQENGTIYRSISQRINVPQAAGKDEYFIITVATDTGFHSQFMDRLENGLFWFNLGLLFISIFLGWLATRLGLKPLREMTRLASGITINNLNQRLDPDSAPPEISGTMQEFNNMLDRLEGSFRRLTDFSSDIAHELRTPVSNLMMQTQFALAKERDAGHYREILFANLDELKRLSRMSSDMLFLARSEHGLLQLDKQTVDLANELKDLIELFEPLATETEKKIILSGAGTVQADPDMLRRAFSNLLSNAIKYAPEKSDITVSIEEDDKQTVVSFMNTVLGISSANLDRLFDRFYRADSSRVHNTEGTGLGLSITRSIINAHGGSLTVEQQGRNILFRVCFISL
ncbi:heavy metal sensor histidine kinase [Serratia sp. Ag2]|uniref:heavy metal sensor histidine kinase n=1 Tax=Serratia sp. Ag2 TaxID=1532556 RepID=UPI0005057690|nr:heavy metal sensor histidine kinase [Serratia sp. Ag2]KFK95929.1 histidine kinase [Serratia sp. Ag2]